MNQQLAREFKLGGSPAQMTRRWSPDCDHQRDFDA
jgi:hypothetical protein